MDHMLSCLKDGFLCFSSLFHTCRGKKEEIARDMLEFLWETKEQMSPFCRNPIPRIRKPSVWSLGYDCHWPGPGHSPPWLLARRLAQLSSFMSRVEKCWLNLGKRERACGRRLPHPPSLQAVPSSTCSFTLQAVLAWQVIVCAICNLQPDCNLHISSYTPSWDQAAWMGKGYLDLHQHHSWCRFK